MVLRTLPIIFVCALFAVSVTAQARRPPGDPAAPVVRVAARVTYSLYRAARRAGLSRRLTLALIRIFHRRVDFRHDVHRGDRFVVLYRRRRNEPMILAAELDIRGEQLRVFRRVAGDGKPRYYTRTGHTLTPLLLRTPLHYTRVSSPFSLHRLNPVLHIYRPHYGVDLAAPRGTPIHAAGDGRIIYRGRDGGYGRLLTIRGPHGKYTTRYAHLERYAHGIHVGEAVRQGEIIGYVGASGLTTGPHLHFEIRVHGKPANPLTVPLPDRVPPARLLAFDERIAPLQAALDASVRLRANIAALEHGGRLAGAYESVAATNNAAAQCIITTPVSAVTLALLEPTAAPVPDKDLAAAEPLAMVGR